MARPGGLDRCPRRADEDCIGEEVVLEDDGSAAEDRLAPEGEPTRGEPVLA
mgnify:CR=1 FL=1